MSSIWALIISLLLLQACAGSKQASSNNASMSESDTMQTKNDTLPKPPPPPASELAPGQAKVIGIVTDSKNGVLYLQVRSVKEYGHSTPPIAAEDTLSIMIGDASFQTGTQVTLVMQHNMPSGSSKMPAWTYIKSDK